MATFFKHQPKFSKSKPAALYSKKPNPMYAEIDEDLEHHNRTSPEELEEGVSCFCNEPEYEDMLGCENDDCIIQWFHPSCLGITTLPAEDEVWYCPDCRQIPKIREKIKKLKRDNKDGGGLLKVNLDGAKLKAGRAKQAKGTVKAKG